MEEERERDGQIKTSKSRERVKNKICFLLVICNEQICICLSMKKVSRQGLPAVS